MRDTDLSYAARNLLGFIHATGVAPRGTHAKTRIEIWGYAEREHLDEFPFVRYVLSPEGVAVAERNRVYKAVRHLQEKGYRLDEARRQRPGHVVFHHEADRRVAFVTAQGRVYEARPGTRYSCEFTTQFRNG